ncbi:MAG: GNAT family N-acetyltransferase [Arcobacter sp.]|nr:GNAT family N-acetyltransferase [Arcobacter sp.]
MFKYKINESIYISIIDLSYASSYEKLVQDDYIHLKEFLGWPYICKTEDLKMEKVEISVAVENIKSRAVCKRLNMKLEGIISNSENINGKIVDHAIYSLHKKGNSC